MSDYDMTTRILAAAGAALLTLAMTACTSASLTEQNFGDSVREMVRAQTYDPSTLESPSEAPIERTDGPLLEGVIDVYRGDVSGRESVGNDIVINVGGR